MSTDPENASPAALPGVIGPASSNDAWIAMTEDTVMPVTPAPTAPLVGGGAKPAPPPRAAPPPAPPPPPPLAGAVGGIRPPLLRTGAAPTPASAAPATGAAAPRTGEGVVLPPAPATAPRLQLPGGKKPASAGAPAPAVTSAPPRSPEAQRSAAEPGGMSSTKFAPPVPTIAAASALEPAPVAEPRGADGKPETRSEHDGLATPDARDDAVGDEASAERDADDEPTEVHVRPPRLPIPGKSVGVSGRPRMSTSPVLLATPAEEKDSGAPSVVRSDDTAALISGLAAELVREVSLSNARLGGVDDESGGRVAGESAASRTSTARSKVDLAPTPFARWRRHPAFPAIAAVAAAGLAGIVFVAVRAVGGNGEDAVDAAALAPANDPAAPEPELAVSQAVPEVDPTPAPTEPDAALAAIAPGNDASTEADDTDTMPADADAAAEGIPPPPAVAATKPSRTAPKPAPAAKEKPASPAKPSPAAKPEPKSEPAPKPKPSDPNAGKSARDLAKEAKAALDGGQAKRAYDLAKSSYAKDAKSGTAEIMVLAACKLGDGGRAASALAKVNKIMHPTIKSKCKKSGIKL